MVHIVIIELNLGHEITVAKASCKRLEIFNDTVQNERVVVITDCHEVFWLFNCGSFRFMVETRDIDAYRIP